MLNIRKSTTSYEQWLAARLTIVKPDLRAKHEAMRRDMFSFLRDTFYRCSQLWPEVCESENAAPEVLRDEEIGARPHRRNFFRGTPLGILRWMIVPKLTQPC